MVFALFALSLELLVGHTGLVCFGQAAFFGIGAYAAVLLAPQGDAPSLLWLLPASVLAAAAYALFVGALCLRTKGVYFIMVTLAFAQMAYYVVHDTPLGRRHRRRLPHAQAGARLVARPGQAARAVRLHARMPGVVLRGARAAAALRLRPRARRHPRERAAHACHRLSTYPYKLAAFVLSGAVAGLAGFLFAVKDGFVNPELLSWHMSGAVLIMIILGGLGHLRGALIGAFAFELLQELFKSEAVFGGFARHWHLGLGLTIIACVALLPRGLIGVPGQWRERLEGRAVGKRRLGRMEVRHEAA
jgi:branched-chain amino acid transport system permease protein